MERLRHGRDPDA